MGDPYRILFIKPCSGIKPEFIEVPLAFLYLSAYLKKYLDANLNIEAVDLRLEHRPAEFLKRKLQVFSPNLIGISMLAQDRNFLPQWCGFIKAHAPEAIIVIGGPYATYEYAEALLNNPQVDLAVLGEGEKTFMHLVDSLTKKRNIASLPGVAYVASGKVVSNGRGDFVADLDTIPLPDYGLIALDKYQRWTQLSMNTIVTTRKHIPVISSRGCPYGCIYCHNIFGKKIRKRSPENFVTEIKLLYDRYGIREFHIVDDIFNADRPRMHAILNLIIGSRMKIKIAFPNGLRSDLLNEEDLLLLKKAGTYMVTFAVETASPRIQAIINKHLKIDKAIYNINFASKIGIFTRGAFILGFPGESISEIKQTITTARKLKLDLVAFLSAVPFPNTEMALISKKMYPFLDYNGQWYMWDPNPFYQRATGYNLKRVQSLAYLKFYFPFKIIRTFLKVPGKASMIIWPIWGCQIFLPQLFKKASKIMQGLFPTLTI